MASILQRPECVDAPFHQMEMDSTSDDTPSLKRKSISLNAGDGGGGGGGGNETLLPPLSAMSRDERREYRKKLKMDLDSLQGITMKLEAMEQQVRFSDKEVSSVPPPLDMSRISLARQPSFATSDGLGTPGTGNKEKRTPKANQMYSNSEYISAKDKMPPPEKLRPKSLGTKKSFRGELDAKRQKIETARHKRMADLMKMCGTLLKKLMTHKHAWVFNAPVDVVGLGLHDYYNVITRPMDLGTIRKKLEGGMYTSPVGFAEDVRQTFANAMKYNPVGHDVHIMARILNQQFEDRWRGIKEKLDEEHVKCKAEDEVLAGESVQLQTKVDDQQSSLTKKQGGGTPRGTLKKSGKKEMSYELKTELGRNLEHLLETLPPEKVEKIIQIIRKQQSTVSQEDDTLEVDIDSIDNDTLWELHKAVEGLIKPKTKKKPGPKPQEPATENAAKSTVTAPAQGGEGVEEDVDIDVDDNDTPAVFPPVVIDKDTNDGSKSSGGSSSSSSGSSSSESDSGSSSGSESEAEGPRPNGQKPTAAQKDSVVTEPVTESPEEPDVVQNGDVTETPAQKSMESLQSERAVSPEKNMRAAMLKGRFADTILKALEKTFPLKSDNVDPEKLRKEKEELEKKQREDRARLQADAKAAEQARKKAEAEAEAEAKKQREIEREAARRALQQMERTVDLDAHCEILKDFDLMRSSSLEQFQSSAGEVSPANSADGLANFVLPSAGQPNPLHTLGLFMKLDPDEEEEEKQGDGEVAYAEGTDENGEVEEGEID